MLKVGRSAGFLVDASTEFVDGVVFVEADLGVALMEIGVG
jgi:hypothetical protein